jgi:hypothetical protein
MRPGSWNDEREWFRSGLRDRLDVSGLRIRPTPPFRGRFRRARLLDGSVYKKLSKLSSGASTAPPIPEPHLRTSPPSVGLTVQPLLLDPLRKHQAIIESQDEVEVRHK